MPSHSTASKGQGAPARCFGAFGKLLLSLPLWSGRRELHRPLWGRQQLQPQRLQRSEEFIKASPGHLGRCCWSCVATTSGKAAPAATAPWLGLPGGPSRTESPFPGTGTAPSEVGVILTEGQHPHMALLLLWQNCTSGDFTAPWGFLGNSARFGFSLSGSEIPPVIPCAQGNSVSCPSLWWSSQKIPGDPSRGRDAPWDVLELLLVSEGGGKAALELEMIPLFRRTKG